MVLGDYDTELVETLLAVGNLDVVTPNSLISTIVETSALGNTTVVTNVKATAS